MVKKIRRLLGSDNRITARERSPDWKTIYRLQIGSISIFKDLEHLGFVQRKSKTLSLPDISRECLGHFTRGYFDGDGNVWSGKIHKLDRRHPVDILLACFTSGGENILISLKESLRAYAYVVGGSLSHSGRGFHLQYATADSLKLYTFMYYHSKDLYLPRKKDVFDDFLKNRQMFENGPVV